MSATIVSISVLNAGLATAISGVVVVALILLLIQRELTKTAGPRLRTLSRMLMVVIAPLLVVFVAIVVSRLASLV